MRRAENDSVGARFRSEGKALGLLTRVGERRGALATCLALIAATLVVLLGASAAPAATLTRAYVVNRAANTLSVIDTSTDSVVATVAVGATPLDVTVNPAGSRVYVANFGSGNVSVIDTATNIVVATVAVGTAPTGVVVNPAGSRAFVTNQSANSVSVIDTATNTVVATVGVGTSPRFLAVNPSGTRVYVANRGADNVSVIDTATNTVVATVGVGSEPFDVAVNPSGSRAYVTNVVSNNVSVIDTATNTVVATVVVGTRPVGIAVGPAGTVYVANGLSNNVSVLNTANTVVATVAVVSTPTAVAVDPNGSRVYVANFDSNNVSVIDTASNTVVATVAVGANPDGVAVSVIPATPAITWADPADVTYGTALGATQLNATASTPGTFVYTPAAGTVLGAGSSQALSVTFTPTDTANYSATGATVHINVMKATPNRPPACSNVKADPSSLWPPDHSMRPVILTGVTDPDGDATVLTITGVTQDEPLNGLGDGDSSPDAGRTSSSNQVLLRAERSGSGDGRVYRISFSATDGNGSSCSGVIKIGVPKSQGGPGSMAVESSLVVNSFGP